MLDLLRFHNKGLIIKFLLNKWDFISFHLQTETVGNPLYSVSIEINNLIFSFACYSKYTYSLGDMHQIKELCSMFKLKANYDLTITIISDVFIQKLNWYDHTKAKLHKIHEVALFTYYWSTKHEEWKDSKDVQQMTRYRKRSSKINILSNINNSMNCT